MSDGFVIFEEYFPPIDLMEAPPVMEVSEYLDQFPADSNYRATVASVIDAAGKAIALYNRNHGFEGLPAIRITNQSEVNAEGMTGLIRVSHGMVYHCTTVHILNIDRIANISNLLLLTQNFTWIRALMLTWVMLHEYMHGIRQHDASLAELGMDSETQMAIEYDADLCAVAGVYRFAEPLKTFGLSDMDLRKLVLGAVFWCLRTLTTFCKRTTHSTVADRMVQMFNKLATLVESPVGGTLADNNFEKLETRLRLNELIEAFVKLERLFQDSPYYFSEYGNMGVQVRESLEQGHWIIAAKRWNQIRLRVTERIGGQNFQAELQNSRDLRE